MTSIITNHTVTDIRELQRLAIGGGEVVKVGQRGDSEIELAVLWSNRLTTDAYDRDILVVPNHYMVPSGYKHVDSFTLADRAWRHVFIQIAIGHAYTEVESLSCKSVQNFCLSSSPEWLVQMFDKGVVKHCVEIDGSYTHSYLRVNTAQAVMRCYVGDRIGIYSNGELYVVRTLSDT